MTDPAPTAKPAKCARMSVFSPPVPVKASSAIPASSGEALRIHGFQSRMCRRQPYDAISPSAVNTAVEAPSR